MDPRDVKRKAPESVALEQLANVPMKIRFRVRMGKMAADMEEGQGENDVKVDRSAADNVVYVSSDSDDGSELDRSGGKQPAPRESTDLVAGEVVAEWKGKLKLEEDVLIIRAVIKEKETTAHDCKAPKINQDGAGGCKHA